MDVSGIRILVIGDDTRSALAISRSLWRAGAKVSLASESAESPVVRSRAVRKVYALPSSAASISAWSRRVKEIFLKNEFDAVLPATETAWLGLMRLKDSLPESALRFLPDEKAFECVYRKSKTLELARSLSIPVPESHLFTNETDAFSFLEKRGFREPYVGKPDVSKVWAGEYRVDLGVRVLETKESAQSFLRSTIPFAPVLIQARVPGIGIGQEFLASNGEIILSFQHERIHEPAGSGGSSYRKSVLLHAGIFECSRALIRALKWNGVCMIEYRWDPKTDMFWMMEINGRFWGSLPLAIRAGADFPAALIFSELGDAKPSDSTYRIGLFARNLVKDFRWVFETQGIFGVFKEGAIALFRFFSGQEIWDTFQWNDPRPFFAEWKVAAGKAFRRVPALAHRIIEYPFFFLFGALMRTRRIRRICAILTKNPRVLFVCYGNIARSPFAERSARKIFSEAGIPGFSFSSRGYYPESGRAPALLTSITAGEFGVSLDSHRSKIVFRGDIERAGAVFCMDRENYQALIKGFPQVKEKLFLLESLVSSDPYQEIPDPWMKSYEHIRSAFVHIQKSIKHLRDRMQA